MIDMIMPFQLWLVFLDHAGYRNSEQRLMLLGILMTCHAGGRGFEPRHSRHRFRFRDAASRRAGIGQLLGQSVGSPRRMEVEFPVV